MQKQKQNQSSPTKFTFSINSMLVLTATVAIWLVMFRMDSRAAFTLIVPITYVLVIFHFRKPQWTIWTPAILLLAFFIIEALSWPIIFGPSALVVLGVCSAFAIIENAIRKAREDDAASVSLNHLIKTTLINSSSAGATIGVTLALLMFAVATVTLIFDLHSAMEVYLNGAVGFFLFPIFIGALGLLLGFPLTFVVYFLVHHDSSEQEYDANKDSD